MDDFFLLTVPFGTVIIKGSGEEQVLEGTPGNAVELWKNGSRTLCLKKGGEEILSNFTKQELDDILQKRKIVGFQEEIKIIQYFISSTSKQVVRKDTQNEK